MDRPTEDDGFDLVDLTGVGLDELMQLEPSVLAHSMRRILEDIDHPQDAVAGWQSAL
jgi:FXSXX-COOH protein